jgi:hypothetical protein
VWVVLEKVLAINIIKEESWVETKDRKSLRESRKWAIISAMKQIQRSKRILFETVLALGLIPEKKEGYLTTYFYCRVHFLAIERIF